MSQNFSSSTMQHVPAIFSSDEIYNSLPHTVPNAFDRVKEPSCSCLWWLKGITLEQSNNLSGSYNQLKGMIFQEVTSG